MKKLLKNLFCFFLCILFILPQAAVRAVAGEKSAIPDDIFFAGEFAPPTDTSIVFYLNNTTQKAYTKIANKTTTLWVGDHHRFTVAANLRDSVTVRWYSSNQEIAVINKKTGELTALAAGTVKVTMWDSKNKEKESFMLTVNPVPVLPEIPQEWYEIEENKTGVILYLKPEYRFLYEQCTMLKFPVVINEKPVSVTTRGKDINDFYLSDLGFTNLKMIEGAAYANVFFKNTKKSDGITCGLQELILYPDIKELWLYGQIGIQEISYLHLPEGIEVLADCFGSEKLQEIRVPASVKCIGCDRGEADAYGISRSSKLKFCVDGNNSHYYSLFGMLFCYPFYDENQPDGKYIGLDTKSVQCGQNILLTYADQKNRSVYCVPYGVEKIGEKAFYKTEYLRKVVIPDTVTTLGILAFDGCKGLEEIVIPASVTKFEEEGDFFTFDGVLDYLLFGETCDLTFTIVTPSGSAAEAYAIEHGIKYRNE